MMMEMMIITFYFGKIIEDVKSLCLLSILLRSILSSLPDSLLSADPIR